jgi:glucose-1-phosphate cytidylyltransferase
MKTLILAGGLGTRLSEATHRIPKPMVEIGGFPILWHIMKQYSYYGHNDFVVLLGYKGSLIKQFFLNYLNFRSDLCIDLERNTVDVIHKVIDPWKVTLVETGERTMTGSRIKLAQRYVGDERFMLTYGDGICDVNINELIKFHHLHKRNLTMTSIQPDGRFGVVESDSNGMVTAFKEKPKGDGNWINGGFFVCEPQIFDYIPEGDQCVFEKEPLQQLASDQQIVTYKHSGFWQCMDTLRDHALLNEIWDTGSAPWKKW